MFAIHIISHYIIICFWLLCLLSYLSIVPSGASQESLNWYISIFNDIQNLFKISNTSNKGPILALVDANAYATIKEALQSQITVGTYSFCLTESILLTYLRS